MDERTRLLERQARQGDAAAEESFKRARIRAGDTEDEVHCFLHGHDEMVWWSGAEFCQQMADMRGQMFTDWRRCRRCGLTETKCYYPTMARATAGPIIVSTNQDTMLSGTTVNTTGPCTSALSYGIQTSVSSDATSWGARGTRYLHPTKSRAWKKRARLSKQEQKKRRNARKHSK